MKINVPSDCSLEKLSELINDYRLTTQKTALPKILTDQAARLCQKHPISQVSKVLGVSTSTLYNRRSELGLQKSIQSPKRSKTPKPKSNVELVRVAETQRSDKSSTATPTKQTTQSTPLLIAEITTRNGSTLRVFNGANPEILKALAHLV